MFLLSGGNKRAVASVIVVGASDVNALGDLQRNKAASNLAAVDSSDWTLTRAEELAVSRNRPAIVLEGM